MPKGTKKAPAKATKAKQAEPAWEDVTPTVKQEVVADTPEEGVPFGSQTPVMKCIIGFRKHVAENPIEMNGRATAPNGTVYAYYLSDDVLSAAMSYCESQQALLDLGMYVTEQGFNVMQLKLVDIKSGDEKVVEANLGNPQSTADFGTRITYAPKYLVAMMFGISVQTDSDAFNNGNNIKHGTNNETNSGGVAGDVTPVVPPTGNQPTGSNGSGNRDNVGVPSSGGSNGQLNQEVTHSQSYPVAKSFIERALTVDMLNTAEDKVKNAKQLHDFERDELMTLISEKRKTVK